jgi:hypothetical protein
VSSKLWGLAEWHEEWKAKRKVGAMASQQSGQQETATAAPSSCKRPRTHSPTPNDTDVDNKLQEFQ